MAPVRIRRSWRRPWRSPREPVLVELDHRDWALNSALRERLALRVVVWVVVAAKWSLLGLLIYSLTTWGMWGVIAYILLLFPYAIVDLLMEACLSARRGFRTPRSRQ